MDRSAASSKTAARRTSLSRDAAAPPGAAAPGATGLLPRGRHRKDPAQPTGDRGLAQHRAPAQISQLNTFHKHTSPLGPASIRAVVSRTRQWRAHAAIGYVAW